MPGNDGTPDLDRPVQFTNYFMLGYKLKKDIILGGLLTTGYFPVLTSKSLKIYDPAIRVTDRGLFRSENFRLIADLRIFLPLTENSKKLGLSTAIQSFQMLEYSLPKTNWTIGSLSSFKLSFYETSTFATPSWSIYMAPNLNYYFTDDFSLSLFAGATITKYSTKQSPDIEDTYLGPGLNFTMKDSLTISPALILPPQSQRLTNMSLLIFLTGNFL